MSKYLVSHRANLHIATGGTSSPHNPKVLPGGVRHRWTRLRLGTNYAFSFFFKQANNSIRGELFYLINHKRACRADVTTPIQFCAIPAKKHDDAYVRTRMIVCMSLFVDIFSYNLVF